MSAPFTSTPPDELKQKRYVVAFLDFLGASEKMSSPKESDKFLQKIKKIYDFIKKTRRRAKKLNIADVEIRIFSDNIVLAKQVDEDSPDGDPAKLSPCFSVMAFAYTFMFESLKMGLWLRGAITIGDFLLDETFIYGEALVNAYRLENTSAVYPRIIIDQNLISLIRSNNDHEHILLEDYSTIDFDGVRFLNIFNSSFGFYTQEEKKEFIEVIGKNISAELSKNNSDAKKRQKYYWLMGKFNRFCENSEFREQRIEFNDNSGF